MSRDIVCKIGTIINIILVIILDVLKFLDILTTRIGLDLGAIEVNILYSYPLLFYPLFLGFLITLNVAVFVCKKEKLLVVVLLILLFMLIPIFAYIVTNNVLVIFKIVK